MPQISVNFRTLPSDHRGAPHTLEHLLLGKGAAGRKLNTLMPMRMGSYTAGTYTERTNYQFSSAAGPAEFYELLGTFLDALVRPDFTEEEARREVAHIAVVEEDGRPRLEEKGTVYTEMVARTERADYPLWDQLQRAVYGAGHPLAFNSGGEPAEIWRLKPADIRAFHAAHYRLDGNMQLAAALPSGWDAADFLARLNSEILRLEPRGAARAYAGLPPPAPAATREIQLGRYPSDGTPTPQDALMAWAPYPAITGADKMRLQYALSVLGGGETSYLYRDLVDQKTRKLEPGPTGVYAGANVLPVPYVTLSVSGLPPASINAAQLGRLRDVVMDRVRWLHALKPGSPELAETAEKARSQIRAGRRSTLKSMEGPPMFGERSTGDGWNQYLDELALEPDFVKTLGEGALLDELLADLDAGRNPWAPVLERAGLLEPPYVSAVLPDAALLQAQKAAKLKRLAAAAAGLASAYGLPEAQALARYRAEAASATAVLAQLESAAARPSFLREPPLELDSLDWSESRLPSGPRLVTTRFQTPFTDIRVTFDLSGIAAGDRELLPLLASAVGSVGVTTRAGERLDYIKTGERQMTELYGAGVGADVSARSGRAGLTFAGFASSPEEVDRSVEWLENYLLRPNLTLDSRGRLIDVLRGSIQGLRGLFEQDEETWVSGAVAAYKYQDKPLYMHLSSPFTTLRHLNRLRWRLAEPAPEELAVLRATMTAVAAAAGAAERSAVEQLLAGVDGEPGEYLRWEFSHLPENSWRGDLRELSADFLADVGRSTETIHRLQDLASKVLVRAGARVHLNGSAANIARAVPLVDALLARLPAGKAAGAPPRGALVTDRLRARYPGLERPAHVALVNNSGKTGTVSVWTPASDYRTRGREELLGHPGAGRAFRRRSALALHAHLGRGARLQQRHVAQRGLRPGQVLRR